ncbi:hypothetical protein [Sulfurimonas sp.]
MKKYLNISNIAYSVDNVGDDQKIEVNGIIVLHNEYKDSIEFSLEYTNEDLDFYSILEPECIDFENLGLSLNELENMLLNILPMEDIENDVCKRVEEKEKEDREYIEYLQENEPCEYMHQMKNNFGGFLYE